MNDDEVMEVTEEVETSDAEIKTPTMRMEEVRSETVIDLVKKDSEYQKKLKEFKKAEEKRVQAAEKKLLPRCTGCSKALRSKLDAESYTNNGSCFTCYTTKEKFKTDSVIETKLAEEFDRMAALDFADFQNLLFGDELGERSLMIIYMKIKREGYDLQPIQVSLAATAWAMDHYANTTLPQTRHVVERAPISQILERVPKNTNEDIKKLYNRLSAESNSENLEPSRKGFKKEYVYMGVIGGISLMLPILMNKGR